MTFLEAASSGLPIVYCDEQMTEGLTERNSILTDGIDGPSLARTFNELFSDPHRLENLSRGSFEVAQEFRFDNNDEEDGEAVRNTDQRSSHPDQGSSDHHRTADSKRF